MYQKVFTILRGTAYEAAEHITDANALTILRQQIRDSTHSIRSCKCTLANAIAQQQRENAHLDKLTRKIADLECRIVGALEGGDDQLALQGAEALAELEEELANSQAAQQVFQDQIDGQRAQLREAQSILRELQRGERLAAACQASQRIATVDTGASHTALKAAQDTLLRLRERQQQERHRAEAMMRIEQSDDADEIANKLARAGFGKPIRHSGKEVLARLKAKNAKAKSSSGSAKTKKSD